MFLQALWQRSTLVACSDKGYASKMWQLPNSWKDTRNVTLIRIITDGPKSVVDVLGRNRTVTFSLEVGEVIAVRTAIRTRPGMKQ